MRCKLGTVIALCGSAVVMAAAGAASGQVPIGYWLMGAASPNGATADGLSADGSLVVGNDGIAGGGFLWTRERGRRLVTSDRPEAISGSGFFIGGSRPTVGNSRSATRQAVGGSVDLTPNLPGCAVGVTHGLSFDGAVAVGVSRTVDFFAGRAWRWTPEGGTRDLGVLPGIDLFAEALGVSHDGRAIAGRATGGRDVAFRWDEGLGLTELAALPSDRPAPALGNGISADGRVVVGSSRGVDGIVPVRWEGTNGAEELGRISGFSRGSAKFASGDGSVIMGDVSGGGIDDVFVWTSESGSVLLREYASLNDVTIPESFLLGSAQGISADGRTLICSTSVDGIAQGFVLTVPSPASTAVAFGYFPTILRRRRSVRSGRIDARRDFKCIQHAM